MMEPPPARRIAGTAYFADRNTPSRLTAVCRRQSANDISIALHRIPMPALATITSKRPEATLGGFDHAGPVLLDTYVLMQEHRLAAGASDIVNHGLAAGIIQVGNHYLGAFTRQCCRTSRANP
jgi:hypothetical protein